MIKKLMFVFTGVVLLVAALPAVLSSKAELVRSIEVNADVEKTHR
jgi:hypothetical protein